MARYLLGESAAAWLRGQMARKAPEAATGQTRRTRFARGEPDEYPHPFELRYAADAGAVDSETGAAAGAWIIYLPERCLVIGGEAVDLTADMTAVDGYPDGWYDLTEIFDGTDPEDFDLFLDASPGAPKFVIAEEDAACPVLVTKVEGNAVKAVVKSALVIGGGAPKPFDIETEEVEGTAARKVVRCRFRNFGMPVTLQDFTLPAEPSAADSLLLLWTVPAETVLTEDNYNSFWALAMESTVPSEVSGVSLSIKLYDFDASGNVVCDYRDAPVSSDLGLKDNNTIADNDPANAGMFNMALHLKGFYGTARNLSAVPNNFDMLVRTTPSGGTTPGLFYITKLALLNWLAGGGGGGGGGSGGDDDPGTWVSRLNGLNGVVKIVGGEGIRVDVDPDKNTIKISYEEGKEEDEEPVDQCAHPGGGVVAGDGGGGGNSGGGGHEAGGVPAEYGGTTHGGYVDCCNSDA